MVDYLTFKNISFKRALTISCAVHLFIIPAIMLSLTLFKPKPEKYTAIQVAIISDLKNELPTLRKKDADEAVKKALGKQKNKKSLTVKPKKAPKKAPKKKKLTLNQKARKDRSSIIDRLKRISKLKKRKTRARGYTDGSPGIEGTTLAQASKAGIQNWYVQKMTRRIHANFNVPPVFDGDRPTLSTNVVVKLNHNGSIRDIKISKSSRNTIFDDLVLASVKNSAPFWEVPDEFKKQFSIAGIEFGFRRSDFK